MSTDVTMQELELETAELLPARETLSCCWPTAAAANSSVTQRGRQHEPVRTGNVSAFNGVSTATSRHRPL